MTIIQYDGKLAVVRLELSPEEIPALLEQHAKHYPGATDLEVLGAKLQDENYPPLASVNFVRQVCRWGGGDRLISRILVTGQDRISEVLHQSVILADQGLIAEAVAEIQKLPYLGQSFASKQLRFLRPMRAVILDSVIRDNLGYPETGDGYTGFLRDCEEALRLMPTSPPYRICDIEAAIFAKIQGY
jgi:hypothetical protein